MRKCTRTCVHGRTCACAVTRARLCARVPQRDALKAIGSKFDHCIRRNLHVILQFLFPAYFLLARATKFLTRVTNIRPKQRGARMTGFADRTTTVTLRCAAAFTDDPMIPDSNEFLPRAGRTRGAIAPLRACKSNYAGRDVQQSEYYSVPYRPSNVTRPCRASPPFNVRVDGSRKTRGMYLYTKRRASDFISAGAASRARDTQRGALARARTQSRTCTRAHARWTTRRRRQVPLRARGRDRPRTMDRRSRLRVFLIFSLVRPAASAARG